MIISQVPQKDVFKFSICQISHCFGTAVCPINTHGQRCQQCGHCQTPQCDWTSERGVCFDGCTAGYKGDTCKTGIKFWKALHPYFNSDSCKYLIINMSTSSFKNIISQSMILCPSRYLHSLHLMCLCICIGFNPCNVSGL